MFIENLTFVIFTFNESSRIERVIQNFNQFGNILVVDNFSIDNTVEIAKGYGCDILMHKNQGWVEEEDTVQLVKNTVKTEWIYWAFADEMISVETLCEIGSLIRLDKYEIIKLYRKNYYCGVFLHNSLMSLSCKVFRINAIDFTGNIIHGFGKITVPDAKIITLDNNKYFIHHFISKGAKSWLLGLDLYSDIESNQVDASRSGLLRLFLRSLKIFLIDFIFRGGWKAGRVGLYAILHVIYYIWLVDMKQFEVTQSLNLANIEKRNDLYRDEILKLLNKRKTNEKNT